MYSLLKSSPKKCKEALYHQRQKLPRLRRQLDNNAYQEAEHRLDQLMAAEAISAQNMSFLKEGELEAHMDLLTRQKAWPQSGLPDEFVEELLRKRLKDNIGQTQVVFDIVWPCPMGGSSDASFDVLQPKLRESAFSLHQKVELMRHWLVNEFLAEHMRNDKAGANAVRSLADMVEKRSGEASAFLNSNGHVQSQAILADVFRLFSVLAATVQQAAVTSTQMDNLCKFSDGEQQSAEARVVAKFLERPWWGEQMKTFWRHASSEAVAGPRLKRVIDLLSTTESDVAWEEAKSNMAKWQQLRSEVVESVYIALAGAIIADVASFTGDAATKDEARLQKTLERLDWLSGTPAHAKLHDAEGLRRQVVTAQASCKVARGLDLLVKFMHPETSHTEQEDVLKQLVAAFENVRGLHVEPGKVEIARNGVEWICNRSEASREIAKVGQSLASLIPMAEDVDQKEGPEREKWQALTAQKARLNKSVEAQKLLDVRAEGDLSLKRVTEICDALTSWEAESASVECVPPNLGQQSGAHAIALRASLRPHARTLVEAA